MKRRLSRRGAAYLAPLGLILLLSTLLIPGSTEAQGGIGISGSFYRQPFEIPQGSSVSGPSIDVVVFNTGNEALGVRMNTSVSPEVPPGVINITLSEDEFTIPAGGHQQVLVGVEVSQDAVPGEYTLSIVAESYKEGAGGIQLVGAASESATLTVVGESALVRVEMVNPAGEPMIGVVRLFKVLEDGNYEFAYSDNGTLEARVSPGSFIASAYIASAKLAEQNFTIAAGEEKTITLTVSTIYFEGFGVVPNYYTETGKLAFCQIVYAVKNLYQRVDSAEVVLLVNYEGNLLEEISLANLSPLEIGRVDLSYSYLPAQGWRDGEYSFKLQLLLNGNPYASSAEKHLQVGAMPAPTGVNKVLIGVIIAAVVAAIVVVSLVLRRKQGKAKS